MLMTTFFRESANFNDTQKNIFGQRDLISFGPKHSELATNVVRSWLNKKLI